jgi:molybdopterin converting factor small subunit
MRPHLKKDGSTIEGTTQMSTVSKLQQRLGSLSTARVENNPVQVISRLSSEPSFADAVQNAKTPAWDPHEVWLNRVKKPREQRSAD